MKVHDKISYDSYISHTNWKEFSNWIDWSVFSPPNFIHTRYVALTWYSVQSYENLNMTLVDFQKSGEKHRKFL